MIIPSGMRSDQLIRLAGLLRRYGVDFNAIYESMRAINADHCEPPLPEDEVRSLAASAARYAPADSSSRSKDQER
jgi:hypothetical protein